MSSVVDNVVNGFKLAGDEFAGVFDAISVHDRSMRPCFDILDKLGGGNMAVLLPPPDDKPASVTIGRVLGWAAMTRQL